MLLSPLFCDLDRRRCVSFEEILYRPVDVQSSVFSLGITINVWMNFISCPKPTVARNEYHICVSRITVGNRPEPQYYVAQFFSAVVRGSRAVDTSHESFLK